MTTLHGIKNLPISNRKVVSMRRHDHWKNKPSFFLKAASYLYALGFHVHQCLKKRQTQKASCPVISIGSTLVGGSGKTPITLMLIDILKEWGYQPVVITRGYSGSVKTPVLVNPAVHKASHVGEEALLLANKAPTYVSRQRCWALDLFPVQKNMVILLDDGHQHHSLHKDISFLVMNTHQGIGNGYLLPAGPLREPLHSALKRTHGVFMISDVTSATPNLFSHTDLPIPSDMPVFQVHPTFSCHLSRKTPVIAFSALGYPQRFQATLKHLGLCVLHHHIFRDHHIYTPADEAFLWDHRQKMKAELVTTQKDSVKLSPSFSQNVSVIEQELSLNTLDVLETFLKQQLSAKPHPYKR